MRILLVGHGRMGRLVGDLAPNTGSRWLASSTRNRRSMAADRRMTGGAASMSRSISVFPTPSRPTCRRWRVTASTSSSARPAGRPTNPRSGSAVADAGIGVVAAPNFSTGVVLFEAIVARAAALFAAQPEFGAFLHEAHHAAKKDAPSGTALLLTHAMVQAGFQRPIDVSSTRAGFIPGTHTVGFDGPAETIVLSHAARDRTRVCARGAHCGKVGGRPPRVVHNEGRFGGRNRQPRKHENTLRQARPFSCLSCFRGLIASQERLR